MKLTFTEYLDLASKLDDINWFAYADQTLDAFKKRIETAREVLKLAKKHNPEIAEFIKNFGIPTMEQELHDRTEAPASCRDCICLSMDWVREHPNEGGCFPENAWSDCPHKSTREE
jgi:hypothetical protein